MQTKYISLFCLGTPIAEPKLWPLSQSALVSTWCCSRVSTVLGPYIVTPLHTAAGGAWSKQQHSIQVHCTVLYRGGGRCAAYSIQVHLFIKHPGTLYCTVQRWCKICCIQHPGTLVHKVSRHTVLYCAEVVEDLLHSVSRYTVLYSAEVVEDVLHTGVHIYTCPTDAIV